MNLQEFKKLDIPDSPGVYSFKIGKDTVYIGKATSLRERLRSYFSDDLIATRGRLLVDMVTKSTSIEFEIADSVLEAFIRETELIKKYQPIYNTKDKDNKSFNYVVITEEDFPRVLTMRGRNLEQEEHDLKFKYVFGPYPFGAELREALKIVRRIFPYRDTCIPAEKLRSESDSTRYELINKPCFNRTIGLCPGVCTGEISKEEYARTIQHIRLFFSGKKSKVLDQLRKEMMEYAKKQEFEKAGDIKRTIFALEHIKDVSMIRRDKDIADAQAAKNITEHTILNDIKTSKRKKQSKDLIGLRYMVQDWQGQEAKRMIRIESYDIAHMSGSNMVGVMVVMTDGEFDRSQYRKFNIQGIDASNDTGALSQVLERRFSHTEWKWPDVIVIDGGELQLNAAYIQVQKSFNILLETYPELNRLAFPAIVSIVKDNSHKAKEILARNQIGLIKPTDLSDVELPSAGQIDHSLPTRKVGDIVTSLQLIHLNEETHRFAITFHKKKRSIDFLPSDAKKVLKKAKERKKNQE